MREDSLKFMERLLNQVGPSGFEGDTANVWKEEAEKFADKVWRDYHGNTIAVVNEGKEPRIMLAGHIDEIGFMVKYIDDKGYISFAPIGGWDPQIAQGQRVWIKGKKGKILGVIGKKPIHLLKPEERKKVVEFQQMFIDIGAKDKKEAEEYVSIGDPIVIAHGFDRLLGDKVVARGFDDRIGAFAVLEALRLVAEMKDEVKASVYSVATVQEEIGLRGATTSAFGINPHIGIAVDVTFAMDTPGVDKKLVGDIKIGGGPVIARGPNINPRVFELLVKTAEEEGIPYQIEGIPRGTGTDANAIQLTRSGVATGLVSIPNRYMHSPVEVVSVNDVENVAKLLAAFIKRVDENTELIPF